MQKNEFKLIEVLSKFTGTEIPKPIKDIAEKEILHEKECDKDAMKSVVKEILHI